MSVQTDRAKHTNCHSLEKEKAPQEDHIRSNSSHIAPPVHYSFEHRYDFLIVTCKCNHKTSETFVAHH
ncbi:hypothetical protein GBA52_029006 [Prunus armeniaca]|nr:hypothetical protein GBA52_029006 [Prunus armeniaca]